MEVILDMLRNASENSINRIYGQSHHSNQNQSTNSNGNGNGTQSIAASDNSNDSSTSHMNSATSGGNSGEKGEQKMENRESVWGTKIVFQALSGLARCIVMRLLFLADTPLDRIHDRDASRAAIEDGKEDGNAGITKDMLLTWLRNDDSEAITRQLDVIEELTLLRILLVVHVSNAGKSEERYRLNKYFQRSLIYAITSPCEPWQEYQQHTHHHHGHGHGTEDHSDSNDSKAIKATSSTSNPTVLSIKGLGKASVSSKVASPSPRLLESYCQSRWDVLLRLLVGAPITDSRSSAAATTKGRQSKRNLAALASNIDIASGPQHSLEQQQPIHQSDFVIETIGDHVQYMTKFVKASKLAIDDVDAWGRKSLAITAKGYEFMLKDFLSQVWSFVHAMLVQATETRYEALNLLFMLSFCEVGRGYLLNALTVSQRQLIFEFSLMGLVVLPTLKSKYFYPTRVIIDVLFRSSMATSKISKSLSQANGLASDMAAILTSQALATSSAPETTASGDDGPINSFSSLKIVVETNNQVVAYLTSDLHFAMVSLFVDIHLRMPNMILGHITRERVKRAYKLGIKSSQIIDFLTSHAHPIVAASRIVVPENVTDLLRVWENEVYRIACEECVVFTLSDVRGLTVTHFHDILAHMKRLGTLLWLNEATRMVAVTPAGATQLQSFAQEELGLYHVY